MTPVQPWRRAARSIRRPALAALILAGGLVLGSALAAVPAASVAPATAADRGAQAAGNGRSTAVIGLRRKQSKLSAFAEARATPGTAAYRNFEPVGSLAEAYGATDSTWARVRGYLRRRGIRNAKLDLTRGFATAQLSRRQRRRAFPAPRRLRNLIGPVLFAASSAQRSQRAGTPRVGAGGRSATPQRTGTPAGCAEGVGSGGFTPNQYLTAYGIDPLHARGLLGQGMRIAFVEIDGFSQAALDEFAQCFGFAPPRPTVHLVGLGRQLEPGNETQLDTQVAAAIAPLARMDIFQAGESPVDWVRLFAAPLDPAITGGEPPDVISSSLGFCERDFGRPAAKLVDYVVSMAAGAGITVVNAAGDSGSSTCFTRRRTVAYPATSSLATAVGGTRLTLTDSNEIDSEVVWNDRPFGSPSAGGGGTSRFVHRPTYQQARPGPFASRTVPDVAFHSSDFPGYAIRGVENGGWAQVDGTSAAAPLLGAGALLAAQAAARAEVERPGLLNPLLYEAARDRFPGLVNDVTEGDNDIFLVGCCSAVPGYDRASGWGSLDLEALAELVVAAGR